MTQHTPYDTEITRLETAEPDTYTREQWQWVHGLAEGYRVAKAEDAALLAAAKLAIAESNNGTSLSAAAYRQLRAAIAPAEKEEE